VTYSGEDVVIISASPPIVTVLGSTVNVGLLHTCDNAAKMRENNFNVLTVPTLKLLFNLNVDLFNGYY